MPDRPAADADEVRPGRSLTRRRFLRHVGAGSALVGLPVVLGVRGDQANAGPAAQDPAVATPGVGSPEAPEEASQYRPQETVGSPAVQATGEAVGEGEVGPAPEEADAGAAQRLGPFMALSAALVGGGRLDEARGAQYLAIAEADPTKRQALDELLAATAAGSGAPPAIATPVAAASEAARDLSKEILGFWYLGVVGDQPVEDRAGFWFGLSSWQAVQYTPATSACKAFGIWAQAPRV